MQDMDPLDGVLDLPQSATGLRLYGKLTKAIATQESIPENFEPP